MIEIKNITKKYADFTALDNLNLSVQKGEIFGFTGPNGAGKTTTIKIIGGLLEPTSGEVFICGINTKKNPKEAKQKIGFIPDRPYIYEKLTGFEFLKFTADLYKIDPKYFLNKAYEYLKIFALLDWKDDLIEAYSHGMKQRLVMASALIHDPDVIIVDEPMVGLDPIAIKMVKNLFKNLAKQEKTIFMSTHTLQIAESICDRIGIINKGRLIATGTMDELRTQNANTNGNLEEIFLNLTDISNNSNNSSNLDI